MTFLRSITLLFLASFAFGQNPGSSFSVSSPVSCGTLDNAIVTALQVFGQGSGFACMKTLIFPQFAVGTGWTTQVTGFLPTQPVTAGLVLGNQPSFSLSLTPGPGATDTVGNNPPVPLSTANGGCTGLWNSGGGTLPITHDVVAVIGSSGADQGDLTGLAVVGGCGAFAMDALVAGLGQGPIQMQVFAPNQMTLAQATAQVTYFYNNPNFSWQVTVNPVDINNAKNRWTAPLYQGLKSGNNYVTAFTVVNASGNAQSATISVRDGSGNPIATPFVTPVLGPGCGCNQLNQNAVGEFYAKTVGDVFPGIGDQFGSIEFTGNSGPILVLVLRVINNTLGSVPAR